MNSPIKWIGGKSQLRDKLYTMFPSHHCYVEVFGGAGWCLFGKERSNTEVINDVHSELIKFYRVVRAHPECLKNEITHMVCSREEYDSYRKMSQIEEERLTDVQRAARFYYMIHFAFGGAWADVFGVSPTRFVGGRFFDMSVIDKAHERLKHVYVEHGSFADIIPRWDREDTFFMCDPPYIDLKSYSNKFNNSDHHKLARVLGKIKGKFMVTINDCKLARQLYADYYMEETTVSYTISTSADARKEYGELIVTNYSPDEFGQFIDKSQTGLGDF